jgi:hypothetical protein
VFGELKIVKNKKGDWKNWEDKIEKFLSTI